MFLVSLFFFFYFFFYNHVYNIFPIIHEVGIGGCSDDGTFHLLQKSSLLLLSPITFYTVSRKNKTLL